MNRLFERKRPVLLLPALQCKPVIVSVIFAAALIFSSAFPPDPGQAAEPFGGNPQKRLSVYNGTILLDGTASIRLGNVGRDIETSGRLYFRPNGSDRGSFIEGAAGQAGQRLEVAGGVNGQDTISGVWAGTTNVSSALGAITASFHGGLGNSVGSAVLGEISNCGAGQSCYAGYFNGKSSSGLFAQAGQAGQGGTAMLNVTNYHLLGRAASFTGSVAADKLRLNGNTRASCSWLTIGAGAELVCSNGRLLAGVTSTSAPDSTITRLYCCEL